MINKLDRMAENEQIEALKFEIGSLNKILDKQINTIIQKDATINMLKTQLEEKSQ